MRAGASQRGFTLMEVMVSITLLSMILLATVTALRTFANTQHSLERMTHRVDEVRSVSGFLRGALESTVVGESRSGLTMGGGSRASGGFLGDNQSMQWKAVLLFGEGYGGSFLVRVGREEDRLMLRWVEADARRGREVDWLAAPGWPLVEGLQEYAVAYREAPGAAWLPEWREGGSPEWVRVSIRARDRYWPELVMRVPR